MKKIIVFLLIMVFTFVTVSFSSGLSPLDSLQGPIDEGLSLLKDPKYKDESQKKAQREKMWEIIRKAFDFTELGGRALAVNYKIFSPRQRKEFTEVFAEVLGNAYLDKIQAGYSNEKVVYINQEFVSDNKAVVKTKIIQENKEIAVDYSMKLKNNEWKAYDIKIEGVSLVQNYRSQFNEILSKETPDELIKRLNKKLKDQEKS
ncbi:MAG: ABC transporter substrate-binding protein [Proteobacteria bacterium]|nr:ABC transporter substrate-binding protein [Pseudomonadota bacterium]